MFSTATIGAIVLAWSAVKYYEPLMDYLVDFLSDKIRKKHKKDTGDGKEQIAVVEEPMGIVFCPACCQKIRLPFDKKLQVTCPKCNSLFISDQGKVSCMKEMETVTDLSGLNPQQKNAILQSVDHNVVLHAGAGSGKTFTMVKRAEYLIRDLKLDPASMMIVTFTNKAAEEIIKRIGSISAETDGMWIGTFHKICVKLIRKFGHEIGIDHFTIMDKEDALSAIRECMKDNKDAAAQSAKAYLGMFSKFKCNLVEKESVKNSMEIDETVAEMYGAYVDYCWEHKMFDFDDLIVYAVSLLYSCENAARWVHQHIRYIMVDECQDTNPAQYALLNLLRGDNNVMLIGDVNQSIYAFRHARPKLLEEFAKTTPNTIKLKLEQNYRSTNNIICAANGVISNNHFGGEVEMFTNSDQGVKVKLSRPDTFQKEADWVASEIAAGHAYRKKQFSDYAIIYRTNAQSACFEEVLTKYGIPYVVVGGSFYDRKEIKDLLAFCRVAINPNDTVSFQRALTTFGGIGNKTADNIITYARTHGLSLDKSLDDYIKNVASPAIVKPLTQMLGIMTKKYRKCTDIIDQVFYHTDYRSAQVLIQTEEARNSVEMMEAFRRLVENMEVSNSLNQTGGKTMTEILDEISLSSMTRGADAEKKTAVKLLTAHASKGLEFDTVFFVGAHEGICPHGFASSKGEEAIEEERRLFYVAMTRAEKTLYITSPKIGYGQRGLEVKSRSRFIDEIPEDYREYVI